MKRLFGTDGIRGKAGQFPLDEATVSRVGAALVSCLSNGAGGPVSLVLGRDTRASSAGLAAAVAAGAGSRGGRVVDAGVVTTPAVAYLVRRLGASAGVVISASHNPWDDNGVKVFSGEGRKLPDELEAEVERRIDDADAVAPCAAPGDPELARRYVEYLVGTLPHRLDGLTVLIDAANGAAFQSAPLAFETAGARVLAMNVAPDGRNINERCGALHPEAMAAHAAREGADLGIALDGDADRIMAADGCGAILDGDDVLYLWTLELIREGKKPSLVVGTLMTNFGLELALRDLGIELVRTAVGDRYVVEEMLKRNAPIGGEQSGHLIRSDLATTGDGILTGLHLAAFLAASGTPLAKQPRFVRTPQVLKNVMVRERRPLDQIPQLVEAQARAERQLAGRGRIVLRYSGTEPKARVMVEGSDAAQVEEIAEGLTRVIREAIGA